MNPPKNYTSLVLIGLLIIASFLLGTFWTRVKYIEKGQTGSSPTPQVAGQQANPTLPPKPSEISQTEFDKLVKGASLVAGKNSAPVKIVEFSDFECPYCARFHSETYPTIEEKYIKTGKVQFFYRHVPLEMHPNAKSAAIAAECAALQGKFTAMHDILYKNTENLTAKDLKSYAAEIGLNQTQFDDCFDNKKTEDRINSDIQIAGTVGISATPTFFINGKIVAGALPASSFEQTIDALLK